MKKQNGQNRTKIAVLIMAVTLACLSSSMVRADDKNGYDEWNANIRGRIWYVALKKRF